MKRWVLVLGILLLNVVPAYAVTVSITSSIEVINAPQNSQLKVECGPSTGVYTGFTKLIGMENTGTTIVPVSNIFGASGNFFCRASFIVSYGQGLFTAEIPVTIIAIVPVAPALTVIP